MKRQIRISNFSDLEGIQKKLVESANNTKDKLQLLCALKSGMEVLYDMKFYQNGRDPIEDRDLNIIEQLNQQFTYLVSICATMHLLHRHPGDAPFIMNLGTAPGPDIVSENQLVAAEVFSAADPKNNSKLKDDIKRIDRADARDKYVFYHSPIRYSGQETLGRQYPDVKIVFFESIEL